MKIPPIHTFNRPLIALVTLMVWNTPADGVSAPCLAVNLDEVTAKISPTQAVVTRDSGHNLLFGKLVNVNPLPQELQMNFTGSGHLAAEGTALPLSGTDPKAINSLAKPRKIVPIASPVHGVSADFKYILPGYSVTVLQMNLQ